MKKIALIMTSLAVTILTAFPVLAEVSAMSGPEPGFISYFVSAWATLSWPLKVLGILWLLVPVFSIIVATTDTPKDNKIWGKYIYPLLELGAMTFFKAKQKPGDSELAKPFDDDQPWL